MSIIGKWMPFWCSIPNINLSSKKYPCEYTIFGQYIQEGPPFPDGKPARITIDCKYLIRKSGILQRAVKL
jgi:hypothetical protein